MENSEENMHVDKESIKSLHTCDNLFFINTFSRSLCEFNP